MEIALRFQPNRSIALALAELGALKVVKEGFQLERWIDTTDFIRLLGEMENAKRQRDEEKKERDNAVCERNLAVRELDDAKTESDYASENDAKINTSMTVAAQEELRLRR